MKRTALVPFLLLAAAGFVSRAREAYALPIPPEVKSVVAFVFVPDKESGAFKPWGTGFFVGAKDETNPDRFFVYLVTAKHVLQTSDQKDWLPQIFVRINTRAGGSEMVAIPIVVSGAKQTVFLHPTDKSADVALIHALPNEKHFDFKFLGQEYLTSPQDFKQLGIAEGSDVFFTGLFAPYVGARRNFPVVRFGRVALVTDEKVRFGDRDADLYLVETSSYGGNSGSPVFFFLGSDRQPGSIILGAPVLKLAGVMSGTFLDVQPVRAVDTARIAVSQSNVGIAAVVPAYKVWEILTSRELISKRPKK